MAGVLIVLILLVGGGAAGWFLLLKPATQQFQAALEADLQSGAAQLQAGSDDVHKANQDHNPVLLDEAGAKFVDAQRSFQRARARLAGNPYVADAAGAPYIGKSYVKPRLATVNALATMGIALGQAGRDTVDFDRPLLDPQDKSAPAGQRLIAVLKSAGPPLALIKTDLTQAGEAAALVDPSVLPGAQVQAFTKTRGQIQTGLAGIDEFQRLTPVLLEILGASGPRTYLMAQVDPAELRGGGGFIGSFSILAIDQGNMKLVRSGDVATIDLPYPLPGGKKYIAPPRSSLQFTTHGWVFGDANFYTDFPSSARAAENLFLNETGTKVDGVISLDPWAVAALLQVTGPIAIPEYNTTADANTFAEDVFQRTERNDAIVAGRKNYFPVVANHLIEKISTLPSSAWGNLLQVLNSSVQVRHMQVYFNSETAQAEMGRIFWAGSMMLPKSQLETMLEVESNYGADKVNHFVERTYDVTLSLQDNKLKHRVVVNIKNPAPDGYLGGRIYNAYVRFYYPQSATGMVTGGLQPSKYPSDEKIDGMQLADGWIYVEIKDPKPGSFATTQFSFEYTTEISDLAQGHSIYWQKQAGTLGDKVKVTFQNAGRSFTAESDLITDRVIRLTPQGVKIDTGNAAAAHLPILGS